jgi:hypothetical protein
MKPRPVILHAKFVAIHGNERHLAKDNLSIPASFRRICNDGLAEIEIAKVCFYVPPEALSETDGKPFLLEP